MTGWPRVFSSQLEGPLNLEGWEACGVRQSSLLGVGLPPLASWPVFGRKLGDILGIGIPKMI